MSATTGIAWTHHTFNAWWGCTRVSPECQQCYAETFARRTGHGVWGDDAPRRFFGDKHWAEPLKWNRDAEAAGERRRVFSASMSDVFEDRSDLDAPRARLFNLIIDTPWLDWQLLTKRPECMTSLAPASWFTGWPSNIWAGTTVGIQSSDKRIAHLRAVPAAIRFLSMEPLLGPVVPDLTGIHWVIIGGESGARHRTVEMTWIESIVAQCAAAGVRTFVKQDSGQHPGKQGRIPDRLYLKQFPASAAEVRP